MSANSEEVQDSFHRALLKAGAAFQKCILPGDQVVTQIPKTTHVDGTELIYSFKGVFNISVKIVFWKNWFYFLCNNTTSNITATRSFQKEHIKGDLNLSSLIDELIPSSQDIQTQGQNVPVSEIPKSIPQSTVHPRFVDVQSSEAPFGMSGPFGNVPSQRPLFPSIGADDLYPAGVGAPSSGNNGGMYPTLNHPIFHPERRPNVNDEEEPPILPYVPPGARYDPTSPSDLRGIQGPSGGQFPQRRTRPGQGFRFPGEPDNDDFMPPGSSDMFM
ncbi:PI31 proteasome regulator [Schizosaccharomyces octosporus yFS286]|uniref:PI31 proteasome regulator n=1 Tax=Schizosaccharomyces octosporus (strain yFS286) TaxID=483514 RepID=S9RIT9_SCHOY|nr:PI31 proteasome regulator [Schizosaccharomyces octosporus yFS286]EPX73924.1 PI31 proteasome regulator [Schizosaccharomyces octosporus yFS286]